MATGKVDEFTNRMFEAINAMMPDMLAAVARKDYENRRRRQVEGIAKARAAGAYRGRKEDTLRNQAIIGLLRKGASWSTVMRSTGAARGTVSKLAKRLAEEQRVAWAAEHLALGQSECVSINVRSAQNARGSIASVIF